MAPQSTLGVAPSSCMVAEFATLPLSARSSRTTIGEISTSAKRSASWKHSSLLGGGINPLKKDLNVEFPFSLDCGPCSTDASGFLHHDGMKTSSWDIKMVPTMIGDRMK